MVYEGFWDLYCKKPATTDLTAKKLEGWVNKISLKTPTFKQAQPTAPPAEAGEGSVAPEDGAAEEGAAEAEVRPSTEAADAELPDAPALRAIVRIRIPLQKDEPPAEGEEGAEVPEDQPSTSQKQEEKKEDKAQQEIEWADQVVPIQTQAEGGAYQVYVLHQLPQRLLRQTIVSAFRNFLSKELDGINEEEMMLQVESEAEEIEKTFLTTFFSDIPHYDFELN